MDDRAEGLMLAFLGAVLAATTVTQAYMATGRWLASLAVTSGVLAVYFLLAITFGFGEATDEEEEE